MMKKLPTNEIEFSVPRRMKITVPSGRYTMDPPLDFVIGNYNKYKQCTWK